MTIAWPSTPSPGQTVTGPRGEVWSWDGAKWVGLGGTTTPPMDGNLYGMRNGVWVPINIPDVPDYVPIVPLGGRLGIVGSSPASQIVFAPHNGYFLRIDGTDYNIPMNGVMSPANNVHIDGVAGQSLAMWTRYYVYLFDNAGTLTFDFSVTGHETSTTAANIGTQIKQGDNSRSLVGMVFLLAANTFRDDESARLVRSWVNRQIYVGHTSGSGTAAGVWNGIGSAVNFLVWQQETVQFAGNGIGTNATPATNGFGIVLDGNTTNVGSTGWAGTAGTSVTVIFSSVMSEGRHDALLAGQSSAGTVTLSATLLVTMIG